MMSKIAVTSLDQLEEGMRVIVRQWNGHDIDAVVEQLVEDGGDGRAVIDYTDVTGRTGWCYLNQVYYYV